MPPLEHLIYASVAAQNIEASELAEILQKARAENQLHGLTGMLLHVDSDGSFFQVIEGESEAIDQLLDKLLRDKRHAHLTTIIREPIAKRSFKEWTMGFSSVSPEKLRRLPGLNDFFKTHSCLTELDAGRAEKASGSICRRPLAGEDPRCKVYSSLSIKPEDASDPKFSFAFQPIVDTNTREVLSYEALIRGPGDEPGYQILQQVPADRLFAFDQRIRVAAIDLAMRLQLNCHLNLNFLPQSVDSSAQPILTTLEAARRANLPIRRLVLEVLEGDIIHDHSHFIGLINKYRALGLKVAIDDFGAGYSGLNLLADFQPDQVKLDMKLIHGIEHNGPRQSIVRAIDGICFDLGIDVIAEGVETREEYAWLTSQGIHLFQGYLFAKPAFECFPPVHYPEA